MAERATEMAVSDEILPFDAHLPVLDGVRAFSILWVVLHHLPVPLPAWLEFVRVRGDMGVELFFAVSGILVTRSLEQSKRRLLRDAGRLAVAKDFVIRRMSRIWPPYFVLLAVVVGVGLTVDKSLGEKLRSIGGAFWSFPAFVGNYAIPHCRGSMPGVLNVLWSLGFEEQFYALLILAFLAAPRALGPIVAVAGFGSLAARLVLLSTGAGDYNQLDVQMLLHLRFDAVAWACLSWIYRDRLNVIWRRLRGPGRGTWVLITSFLAAAMVVAAHHAELSLRWLAWTYAFSAPVFAIFVLSLCACRTSPLVHAMTHRWVVLVGTVSYEIYLTHEFVVGVLVRVHVRNAGLFLAFAILGSVLIGWLFHRFFGAPAQAFLRKAMRSRRAVAPSPI